MRELEYWGETQLKGLQEGAVLWQRLKEQDLAPQYSLH